MNFFDYIGTSPAAFQSVYVETGLVQEQKHAEFPLNIYTYSRKAVQQNVWDHVTSRCRGIIINRLTGEIIARPFEKFHNYGSDLNTVSVLPYKDPVVWEKMDGFMATLYTWKGVDYIASKGSFHSTHAKWATAWLRAKFGNSVGIPAGHTAVFEGLHRDLRIVVDYKDRQELVLLAIINNETGEEYPPIDFIRTAAELGFSRPLAFGFSLEQVVKDTLNPPAGDEEGYVLTWYRHGQTPFRLKLKFIEYLRLHRMVTGVSPRRVWEVLAADQHSERDEWIKDSTPWFSKFVTKWVSALTGEYKRIENEAITRYHKIKLGFDQKIVESVLAGATPNFQNYRKNYAEQFLTEDNKAFAPVMFAMLDEKDIRPIIWKMVRKLTLNGNPMRDVHSL